MLRRSGSGAGSGFQVQDTFLNMSRGDLEFSIGIGV